MTSQTHPPLAEDPAYLSRQLLTYLGNKRTLLGFIGQGISRVQARLGRQKLVVLDAFSGSGVVSRLVAVQTVELDLAEWSLVKHNSAWTYSN